MQWLVLKTLCICVCQQPLKNEALKKVLTCERKIDKKLPKLKFMMEKLTEWMLRMDVRITFENVLVINTWHLFLSYT